MHSGLQDARRGTNEYQSLKPLIEDMQEILENTPSIEDDTSGEAEK
jgi:hypothetical protein